MPAFSLAILWKPMADAARLRAVAPALDLLLGTDQVQHIGAVLRADGAALHLRVDRMLTGPQVVRSLSHEVTSTGGELIEVWRMQKGTRDAFRAEQLTPERPFPAVGAAVDAVVRHLEKLSVAAPAPSAAPPPPATTDVTSSHSSGETDPEVQATAAPVEAPTVFVIEEVPAAAAPSFLAPPRTAAPGVPPNATSSSRASDGQENRRTRRYEVQLDVAFGTEAAFVHEHATNISRGGLFVETTSPPPVGSTIEVKVTLPSGEVLLSPATVAHVVRDGERPGVGLRFSESEASFIWALDRYLSTLG